MCSVISSATKRTTHYANLETSAFTYSVGACLEGIRVRSESSRVQKHVKEEQEIRFVVRKQTEHHIPYWDMNNTNTHAEANADTDTGAYPDAGGVTT